VRRLPAIDLELRVEDADLALADRSRASEVQVRQRCAVEVEAALSREVLGRDPTVVLPDEFLGLLGVRLREVLVEPGTYAVYEGVVERLIRV
jgi:hypothetical protein